MAADTGTNTKTFEVDPAHSRVGFAVRHMVLTKVRGHFGKLKGSIVLADGQTVPQSIEAEVEVGSIDTREAQRDAHLRSPDFFDAENHPMMIFQSTTLRKGSSNRFSAVGELEIRGTKKSFTLEVEAEGRITDPFGKDRVAYTASGRINRKEFGLAWNQVLETGGLVVADEIEIELEIEAVA